MTATAPSPAGLSRLLRPQSVAVIGASDKPGSLGASVLGNLARSGFPGPIYPVNPRRSEIAGHVCLASIEALPEGVDVAVLAIPRAGIVEAVTQLAARKVGAAIIFAAGFAEGGPDGLAQQQQIARIAQAAGMVIEGPNCLGLVNHVDAIPLTFVETAIVAPAGRRATAIVSQSGAMAAVLSTTVLSRDLPVSLSVSTGNEATSGVEDYVEWLIEDPSTHVISMIVEQFRAPRRFLAAAARARAAGKPIVLLHPGKSSAARESAATHTGAMAGDYVLMRTKVARAGVIFAETLQELADITEILLRCPPLTGTAVAVLGESGAFKALTLDLAEAVELRLAALDDDNAPELRAALPDFVPVSNPLDITAQGLSEPAIYTRALASLMDDDRVGAVVAGIIQGDPVTATIKLPAILAAIADREPTKPFIYAGLDEGAVVPPEHLAALRAHNAVCFTSTERAFRALAALTRGQTQGFSEPDRAPLPVPGLAAARAVVPEYQAKRLLAPLGLPFPQGDFCDSAEQAVRTAEQLGYPVAMKAQAAALGHKSDAGGVALNLTDGSSVRAAWEQMHRNVADYDAAITLDGLLIETMGPRGTEMIAGARNDPEWGPIVLVGFGGVTAELHQDVRLITPDMDEATVRSELMRLKSAPLLTGFRGSPALDVDALAALVVKIGRIVSTEPTIREIDLNPVMLYPVGEGLLILDALMLVDD